ncbi:MAG: hypothetical protein FWE98_05455 [Oscillospiraceae bacterium]|nr:hypothetical protein [Oscillospiraceae bacterium]
MHYSLKALEKALSTPFKLRSINYRPPPLAQPVWDCPDQARSDFFTAGLAKANITPPNLLTHKYYMAGYGFFKPIQGILNPVYATALWLDDNSGRGGVLLVSVDCVGIMNNDVEKIRAMLRPFCRTTGCRAVHVMSTHCHASIDTMGFWGPLPKTGRDPYFFALLFEAIKQAAEAAYARRKDGDLYAGSIATEGIQQDKRLPEVFENKLTRLRFAPRDGGKEIYILKFENHPEVLGSKNVELSADYVHWMRDKLEKDRGAQVIYFNGAIGGMITPTVVEGFGESTKSSEVAGIKTAEAAMSITNERKLSPVIGLIRKEFYIEVQNLVFALCGLLKVMPRERFPSKDGPLYVTMKTEMNYMSIDGVNILMLPGELFPELAYGGYLEADVAAVGGPELNPKPLREIANDPDLIIFGLANDELGYIIPPNDFILDEKLPFLERATDHGGRRHYEETNSTGPNAAKIIAENFAQMMRVVNFKG